MGWFSKMFNKSKGGLSTFDPSARYAEKTEAGDFHLSVSTYRAFAETLTELPALAPSDPSLPGPEARKEGGFEEMLDDVEFYPAQSAMQGSHIILEAHEGKFAYLATQSGMGHRVAKVDDDRFIYWPFDHTKRTNERSADEPPDIDKYWRAAYSGDLEELSWQLERGVAIDAKTPRDQTALLLACEHGRLDIVKRLLVAGAEMNRRDVYGEHTALITAALFGHLEVVQALVEAGADTGLRNEFGRTAQEAAAGRGHEEVAAWLAER